MRKSMIKKWLIGLAVLSVASLSMAATKYIGNATGFWDDSSTWTTTAPVNDTSAKILVRAGYTVTLTNSAVIGFMALNPNDANTTTVVIDGGTLHSESDGFGAWNAIGYSSSASIVLKNGGSWICDGRIDIGLKDAVGMVASFIMEPTSGDVVSSNNFSLGYDYDGGYATAKAYVKGGTLEINGPFKISDDSDNNFMDIWLDGEVVVAGNSSNLLVTTDLLDAMIDDGRLRGNRLDGNVSYEMTVDGVGTNSVTNMVLTAIDSIPNLEGLSLVETTNMLALYGYVVGNITTDNVPGSISFDVIDQDPVAGSAAIASNSPVDLVIQAISVPNVVGMSYTDATNVLTELGIDIGTTTSVYEFDSTPGLVRSQFPEAGIAAPPGTYVIMTINELVAADATVVSAASGDWMNPATWGVVDTNDIPWKETQGYKVKGANSNTVTLADFVAVKAFVGGDGGPFQLDIQNGGHLACGLYGDWAGVGYGYPMTLNVYEGGIFESRQRALCAWLDAAGHSVVTVDGGTVKIGGWITLGVTNSSVEVIIKNGGSFICTAMNSETAYTNGFITVSDGTFAMSGNARVDDIERGMAAGYIRMADGYSYTLNADTGDSVLTGFVAGYDSWAAEYGVGAGTNDPDGDQRNNFYEYAMNGNPTNGQVAGVIPKMAFKDGVLDYTYSMRADDDTLVYTVETSTNLLDASAWTDMGSFVMGTNVIAGGYNEITNKISTVDDKSFIRLKVVQP